MTSIPRARNFRDPAWQSQRTDAQLAEVIRRGGLAVGKSPLMPPNPDLSEADIQQLVRYVRGR